jgi:histidinol phosphatase-like enzyme (inositol monophosphatase family)
MARSAENADEQAHKELLDFAVSIAEKAGPIALDYFRRPLDVEDKSKGAAFDPVTRADREIEAFIRAELSKRFPEHGVLGEEQASTESDSPYRWIIDPIDGTRAFISGMPAWGIMLGLTIDDACTVGVVHQPYLGETFLGGAGGAWLRKDGELQPMRTRTSVELADAIAYCTHPSMFKAAAEMASFERVSQASKMMRFGGDCYSYCLLALGQVDLIVEGELQPYDIIPLIPIIEGAGGKVTNWQGGPATDGGLVVAAANSKLHEQTLEKLNQ